MNAVANAVAAVVIAAGVAAQNQQGQQPGAIPWNPPRPVLPQQNPQQQQPQPPLLQPRVLDQPGQSNLEMVPMRTMPWDRVPDQLDSIWVRPRAAPPFAGFPVFPTSLSGYGAYPRAGGVLGDRPVAQLPPGGPVEPGWPPWARTRDKAPLPFAPDLALLVRHTDRVWHRLGPDEPFEPRFFHAKLITLPVGADVEVRQTGDFELVLHDSTRVFARGPTYVHLAELTETSVRLHVPRLTHLRIVSSKREHVLVLPDSSTLRFGEANAGDEPFDVRIVRVDEPHWLGGRAIIANEGSTDIVWQHATGRVVLKQGHRLKFFLTPPPDAAPPALNVHEGTTEPDGDAVVCRSSGGSSSGSAGHAPVGGDVRWSGARFMLPTGAAVRLDPIQGRPFAAPPEPRK